MRNGSDSLYVKDFTKELQNRFQFAANLISCFVQIVKTLCLEPLSQVRSSTVLEHIKKM